MQLRIFSVSFLLLVFVLFSHTAKGELVDTEGHTVTNQTALGDIDMAKGTMGDLKVAINEGYATTNDVVTATNGLAFSIEINTNFVRRSDNNFSFGLGNILGNRSMIMGDNSTAGIYAFSQGFNNTIGNRSVAFGQYNTLSASGDSAVQYAFGMGNRSAGRGNFTMGVGSGADENGAVSLALGTMAVATNAGAFVWNWYPTDYFSAETDQIFDLFPKYYSHGDGSFNVNPTGGLGGFWIGETNLADHIAAATNTVAEDMKQFVTNYTIVGYSDWRYTGNTSPTAVYSITMSDAGGGNYMFTLNDTVAVTTLGTVTTNTLNPTVLVYTLAEITASRDEIRRNQNGFAYYSDVQALRVDMTNEVQTLRTDVENMDTSYIHFNQITNVNQSVQYLVPTTGQTTVDIKIPESGVTKDWVIYINTNDQQPLTLVLPAANYWVTDETVTNDITTATALYFSQVTEDTFSLGRKEFVPVTVQSATLLSMPARKPKLRSISAATMPKNK